MKNDDIVLLINEIYKIQEDSLMDKILSYCEMNDLSVQEIGDILSESKQFKNNFWIDCVNNNTIKDDLLKQKQKSTFDIDDW